MRIVRRCAALVVLLAGGSAAAEEFKGELLTPPKMAADFSLTTQDGKPFRLSGERGKVVALWFGYTFCPDICPTALAELAQVRSRLGGDGSRFRILFMTVDPERDTQARLREYVRAFNRSVTALTGAPERLAESRTAYGVVAEKRVVAGTSAAYLIDHSALVYVIDSSGRLRLKFPLGMPIEDMTHDIKLLLEP